LIDALLKLNPQFCIFINGDIMFAVPNVNMREIKLSNVLVATSKLRLGHFSYDERRELELMVASAKGDERNLIMDLQVLFYRALSYGIGRHFCYWRGLVLENEGQELEAKLDFDKARRCGIYIPARSWEMSSGQVLK